MKLKISHLSKTYPNGVQALKDIDLTIGKGLFGLLGQNGAGKSTLMRTLATLQDPDKGDIRLGDIDFLEAPEKARRTLGYLPQQFGVYNTVTGEEMLDYIADIKGIVGKKQRKELVMALLNKVNLYGVRKKKLITYSGGMKQRFGIAQALIGNPKLLIVDEPTAGLDPDERNRFYNLLSELGEDAIVILSTHIVEDVTTLCRDMAIIGRGQVLAKGSPTKMIESIKGEIWKKEIGRGELTAHEDRFDVISSKIQQGKISVTVFNHSLPDPSFEAKAPDLEDAYFAVIKTGADPINA
jgi:ABC-type multidrug transport system ATPase subunit